jgi:energy-converting hydrogenase Eha subunit F
MPIYLAPDVEYPRVAPVSAESRVRDISALLDRHGIPRDAPTLVALLRLTWRIAVSFAL